MAGEREINARVVSSHGGLGGRGELEEAGERRGADGALHSDAHRLFIVWRGSQE